MILYLKNIGKRYNYDWIFRNLSAQLTSGNKYAVLGPNGSGKSTLLQIIAGSLSFSEGKLCYELSDQKISKDNIYNYISLAAPYLELIEEYTLKELFQFHNQFKPFVKGYCLKEIAEEVQLGNAFKKQIRYFSSGMKQRAKLAQAFFTDSPILLLDEPCTNLDQEGVLLYRRLLSTYTKNKLTVISSNNPSEYEGSDAYIHITDFK